MKTLVLVLAALTLASCDTVSDVRLKDPATGEIAICQGKGGLSANRYAVTVAEQRGCIEDFKDQGYVRVN